jgi:hypothetical protein
VSKLHCKNSKDQVPDSLAFPYPHLLPSCQGKSLGSKYFYNNILQGCRSFLEGVFMKFLSLLTLIASLSFTSVMASGHNKEDEHKTHAVEAAPAAEAAPAVEEKPMMDHENMKKKMKKHAKKAAVEAAPVTEAPATLATPHDVAVPPAGH